MRTYFLRVMVSPRVCTFSCWEMGKAGRDSAAANLARRYRDSTIQYVEGGTRPRRAVFELVGRRWVRKGMTAVLAPGRAVAA